MPGHPPALLRGALRNVARFAAVWLLLGTVIVFIASVGGERPHLPRSLGQVVAVPFAIAAVLIVSTITAAVALLLLSPVLLVWLSVYLLALWWLERLIRRHARVVAIGLSPLPLILVRPGDRQVAYASIAVAVVYGCVVRLPRRVPRQPLEA
jgi:hypothetical protein